MPRPSALPDWATSTNYAAGTYAGSANKVAPPNLAEGFNGGYGLPAEHLNYVLNNHGAWLRTGVWGGSRKMQQMWLLNTTYTNPGTTIVGDWSVVTTVTGTATANATTGLYGPSVILNAAANGDVNTIKGAAVQGCFFSNLSGMTSFFETDMAMNTAGANNITIKVGWIGASPGNAHPRGAFFQKATGDTNWQCITDDGTTSNTINSGVAATTGYQNLHIDWNAGFVTFYIGGTSVGTSSANVDSSSNAMFPTVYYTATAAGGVGHSITVGTVSAGWAP